jgi:hypothetical protein
MNFKWFGPPALLAALAWRTRNNGDFGQIAMAEWDQWRRGISTSGGIA